MTDTKKMTEADFKKLLDSNLLRPAQIEDVFAITPKPIVCDPVTGQRYVKITIH